MEQKEINPDQVIRGAVGIGIVLGAVCAGPVIGLGWLLWKEPRLIREIGSKRLITTGAGMVLIGLGVWFLWLDRYPLYVWPFIHVTVLGKMQWKVPLQILVGIWWCGSGLVLGLSPLIPFVRKMADVIRLPDFKRRVKNFRRIASVFASIEFAPIGIDIRDGSVVALSQLRRKAHVLVLGATGSGKTTLMMNLILHAIRHGQPCVVIDPKGENSTLDTIIRLGRALSPDFDERFRLFALSRPAASASYNPLKHGNANQLKDRIMEALNWSEQFYQSLAGEFLTVLTGCTEYLNIPLSLAVVARHLGRKEERDGLLNQLQKKAKLGDSKADELFELASVLFKKLRPEDLAGLHAQLSILNNPTIGHLLSFSTAPQELDLREVLAKNQIAYFQLDTLGNADTARRLGRMVVEDLKGLASEVYRTVAETDRKFFPVFIDEFGSFASKEFIEFLKQSRGANFAAHLFCQGMEDLDVVSREFRRQASSNPMTKIALRLDDSETVDEVCAMAGTIDALEQSYQVEGTVTRTKTGLGNMRETKQMRVEHDVIKNLGVGQAVVIEKSPSRVSAVQVWPTSLLDE